MAVKIRLARHGKKNYAFYHIVVADARAPRDGKFIEKIGTYNPNTNPATIDLQFEKALGWLNKGAQPTDTVNSILSKEGVLMMKHLEGGVKKGAFTQEGAEERYKAWKSTKDAQTNSTLSDIKSVKAKAASERMDRETKINSDRADALASKKAEAAAEIAAVKAAAAAEVEAAAAAEVEAAEAAKAEATAKADAAEALKVEAAAKVDAAAAAKAEDEVDPEVTPEVAPEAAE